MCVYMFTYLYFVYIYIHIYVYVCVYIHKIHTQIYVCIYIYISLIVYSEIGISRKKIASVIRSWDLYKLEIKKESVQLQSLTHSGYYR